MNKVIATLFAAALLGAPYVMADVGAGTPSAKDLSKVVEEGPYVETAQKGITLSGYVDAGYQYNFSGADATIGMGNDPTAPGKGFKPAADAQARGEFGLNAVKLALEKPLTDANELQAGFRVDLMLGKDVSSLGATSAAATADMSDSLFVEQAYVQFRLPYGNGVDFKVGKFVTLLGYEVNERPANLNISYGNLFANMGPRENIGVLSSYKFNDTVDAKFGVVEGWGNGNGNLFGTDNNLGGSVNSVHDGAGLTGSVNVTAPGGNANIQNSFYYGINNQDTIVSSPALGSENGDVFVWDMWGNWVPKFANDKLLLGFNTALGTGTNGTQTSTAGVAHYNSSTWYGAALYAKYQFTDIFSLASRADYIHNDDSNKFNSGGSAPLTNVRGSSDIYSWTLTAGFDVIENMMLRAEYRADFGDDILGTGSHGPASQATVEVVYSF